jgi:glutathione S-transferase
MPTILWHIELSHYNEKARWALDYKGVPHERRAPLPGMHRAAAIVLTRGSHRRLPILELEGRRIGDSTAIIAALEASRPEPALYPDDPAERARALALEDEFDEGLAPHVRRFVWQHTLGDAGATADALMTQASPGRRRFMRMLVPLATPAVKLDYRVTADAAAESEVAIRGFMDRVEAELQPSGYLVGDRFSVADLSAAALFTPLICPPERPYAPPTVSQPILALRADLDARPGGAWVHEMYARHRGVSAEVAASL